MRVVNQEKLINKANKKMQKLHSDMAKSHYVICGCCGAKIEFNGYEVERDSYENEFESDNYCFIECPACHTQISLPNSKYNKICDKRYEINHCEDILNKNF